MTTAETDPDHDIDELAVTTLRTLAIDAVNKAGSGYPGTAMAMSPVVYTLFTEHMRYDPDDPNWLNRDRFVLSVGHASILLWGMLHVAEVQSTDEATGGPGPAVTLEDIRHYRQGGSRATGHPEHTESPPGSRRQPGHSAWVSRPRLVWRWLSVGIGRPLTLNRPASSTTK